MAEERHPMPSRRALISGAAALPALAAPATVLAGTDALLIEIGRQWPPLVARINAESATSARCDQVFASLAPAKPDALRTRPHDHGIARHRPPEFHDCLSVGRLREDVPVWQDQITAAGGRVGPYHHQSLARAQEVISAYEAWQAGIVEAERASGFTASIARIDALLAELHALSERARNLPARTLAGLAIKARISAWEREPIDDERNDDQGTLVANSLIRDLLALEA